MRSLFSTFVCILVLALGSSATAKADTVALTAFSGGQNATSGSDQLYGWFFNTSAAITVTAFGVGDLRSDGLEISHDVGIFRVSDQSLLESATVPSGITGTLIDGFRYVDIAPLALVPDSYVIVMTMPDGNGDLQSITNTSVTTSFPVSYVTSAFDVGSALAYPAISGAFAEGMFGPNFTFTAADVPEPASLLLLGTGLVGIGLAAWRRKK